MPGFLPIPKDPTRSSCLMVSQLLNQSKAGWNDSLISELFDQASVAAINKVSMWAHDQANKWAWIKTSNGQVIKL